MEEQKEVVEERGGRAQWGEGEGSGERRREPTGQRTAMCPWSF